VSKKSGVSSSNSQAQPWVKAIQSLQNQSDPRSQCNWRARSETAKKPVFKKSTFVRVTSISTIYKTIRHEIYSLQLFIKAPELQFHEQWKTLFGDR
jgi:hypothetical protein